MLTVLTGKYRQILENTNNFCKYGLLTLLYQPPWNSYNNLPFILCYQEHITCCLLGNFHAFLLHAGCFQNNFFSKISFRNTIRVSNSLDPDHASHFCGPDLGPNSLQTLSADNTRRKRVKLLLGNYV